MSETWEIPEKVVLPSYNLEEEEYRWRDELSISGLGRANANRMLRHEI